jgi:uncharacterized membrane protein YiaA
MMTIAKEIMTQAKYVETACFNRHCCIFTLKGVHLLTMGTFNMFLVLNQFCMYKIKYCWNILSRPNKSMVEIIFKIYYNG